MKSLIGVMISLAVFVSGCAASVTGATYRIDAPPGVPEEEQAFHLEATGDFRVAVDPFNGAERLFDWAVGLLPEEGSAESEN